MKSERAETGLTRRRKKRPTPKKSGRRGKSAMNASLRKMNILLVDDDEWVRDSLTVYFETRGCALKSVETAEAGMAEVRRHSYDLLMIDYQLPGMSGLEFIGRLKHEYPKIKTVLMSSYGNFEISSRAEKMGIGTVIEKPLSKMSMKSFLTGIISRKDRKGGIHDDTGPCEMV